MSRNLARSMSVEPLENRKLMSASVYGNTFVYLESNNPNQGQNAVLAYSENTTTGALTPLTNGRFLTGGTGNRNAGAKLGPDDSDKQVIATPDGRLLFAVNQGSNTVSEFTINSNGSLELSDTAPFSSGGTEPVSLSFSDDTLHVLNRGNGYEGLSATVAGSLTSFLIGEDGQAFPIAGSTVKLPLNLSPAQVLTTADGKFTFVDNFATPSNLKVSLANTLEPFVDNANGSVTAVANGATGLPKNPPLLLGLVEDPVNHIIYTGQAPGGGVATFTYNDTTGKPTYIGSVASQGAATCWLNISPNGKFLYATDSASDALSVYSLTNPLKPAFIQEFYLNGPTHNPASTSNAVTSDDFQFSFDSTGNYLYVLNHTIDDSFQQGNQLHVLSVGSNGKLAETTASPLFLSASYVPATAHPQGLVVVTKPNTTAALLNTVAQLFSQLSIASVSSAGGNLQTVLDALLEELVTASN